MALMRYIGDGTGLCAIENWEFVEEEFELMPTPSPTHRATKPTAKVCGWGQRALELPAQEGDIL